MNGARGKGECRSGCSGGRRRRWRPEEWLAAVVFARDFGSEDGAGWWARAPAFIAKEEGCGRARSKCGRSSSLEAQSSAACVEGLSPS